MRTCVWEMKTTRFKISAVHRTPSQHVRLLPSPIKIKKFSKKCVRCLIQQRAIAKREFVWKILSQMASKIKQKNQFKRNKKHLVLTHLPKEEILRRSVAKISNAKFAPWYLKEVSRLVVTWAELILVNLWLTKRNWKKEKKGDLSV